MRNGDLDISVARSILEARLAVAPEAAALAALATAEDAVSRQRAALGFCDLVVDAADSVVCSG